MATADGTDIFETMSKKDVMDIFNNLATPENISNINTQLAENVLQINSQEINVKYPPNNLTPLKGDTNDSNSLNAILAYMKANGYNRLYFPVGNYYLTQSITVFANLTISGSGMGTYLNFSQGIKGFIADQSYTGVKIENMRIIGSGIDNDGSSGVYFDQTNGMSKLAFSNIIVTGFGNYGIYLKNCWDAVLDNVNITANMEVGLHLENCYSAHGKKLSIYGNGTNGFECILGAGSFFNGTIQENKGYGLYCIGTLGCSFQLYLEQNGYNFTDSNSSQVYVSQVTGGQESTGNTFSLYAIGGLGSTNPTMVAQYGIYFNYCEKNEVSGYFIGHGNTDIYMTSNSKYIQLGAVDCVKGSTLSSPNQVVNNGLNSGFIPVTNNAFTRIESISSSSTMSGAKTVTFAKPFSSPPLVTGVTTSGIVTTLQNVQVTNITTTGFDFAVTNGTNYLSAVGVNFIAMGN